jgi:hypothetical protein
MKEMPQGMNPVPEHFRDDMEAFVRDLDGAERLLGAMAPADSGRNSGKQPGSCRTAGTQPESGRTAGTQPESGPRRLQTAPRAPRAAALRIAAIAASVALVAALGLGLYNRYTEPKDTFDDPYLAYAAVEEALSRVSLAAGKGLALERESETYLQETLSVLNR